MAKNTTWGGPSFPEEPVPVAAEPAVAEVAPEPPAPEPVPEPEPAAPPPPVSALKADHVEYAVEALGVPPEEAESMTKPELVELARTEPAPPELWRRSPRAAARPAVSRAGPGTAWTRFSSIPGRSSTPTGRARRKPARRAVSHCRMRRQRKPVVA